MAKRTGRRKSTRRRSSIRRAPAKRVRRRRTRRSPTMARKKRSSRRKSNSLQPLMTKALGGFGYGVVREPISSLSSRIPVIGGFSDEVALLVTSGLISTYSSGMIKKIADAGVIVEAHNLGRNISFSLGGGSTGGSNIL